MKSENSEGGIANPRLRGRDCKSRPTQRTSKPSGGKLSGRDDLYRPTRTITAGCRLKKAKWDFMLDSLSSTGMANCKLAYVPSGIANGRSAARAEHYAQRGFFQLFERNL